MPPLMRGLLVSAIVLASIDSPLASLATSFVTNIYKPFRPVLSDHAYLRISRWCVAAFGAILAVLAYLLSFLDKILWLAFKIGGVTFGSLLGVFLLGLLTKRRSNRATPCRWRSARRSCSSCWSCRRKGFSCSAGAGSSPWEPFLTFTGSYVLGPVLEKRRAMMGTCVDVSSSS
jgi:Na+/proline symporter